MDHGQCETDLLVQAALGIIARVNGAGPIPPPQIAASDTTRELSATSGGFSIDGLSPKV